MAKLGEGTQTRTPQQAAEASEILEVGQEGIVLISFTEAEDLWEEIEALEVSGNIWGEEGSGMVEEMIQVPGRR